jgi:hypothetical protein
MAELQPGQEIKLPIIITRSGSLQSEYFKSTRDYKASLEKLLALYQESEKRSEDRLAQARKLFDDKLLFLHWSKVVKGLHEGEPYWIVGVPLRAKNGINAYRLSDYIFYIRISAIRRHNRIVFFDAN